MPTTVAFIHPRELLRAGLMSVLKGDAAIRVVGQGQSGKDALKLLKQHPINVLLLYDQLEGEDSFAIAKKLGESYPRLKIVMIGVEAHPTYMARSVAAGVHDYVTEGSSSRQICDSIRNAAAGKLPPPSSPFGKLAFSLGDKGVNPAFDLTPREQQALRHIAHGLSNEEVARSMGISIETAKEHVQNILRKTKMNDRTHAAVWAIKQGLV
jgi:NarL family two-component system response regulator LiaR